MKRIIKKIMDFKEIFKDTNDWNEKTIIGFLSFAAMVIVMVADVVSGFFETTYLLMSSRTIHLLL